MPHPKYNTEEINGMEAAKKITPIPKKGVSKQSWFALILLWLIFSMNANGREITNRVLPGIIQTYGISPDTAGLMGTISALGMAIAALPLSRWVDGGGRGWKRKNRMIFLSGGYLLFMLFNGITPLTSTFSMVLLWQFFRGFLSGPGEAVEVGTLAEWWPKEKNGFAMGFHHTAFPWGTALGGVMVAGLLSVIGMENWRYAYLIFPVMGIVFLLIFWKWSNLNNYNEFYNDTLNKGMSAPLNEIEEEQKTSIDRKGIVLRALKNPNITVTAIVCMLSNFAFIGFTFWMTPFLTFTAGYSAAAASGLSVIYAITGGLGQIFWGHIADKFGAKKTLAFCCLWLVVGFYLMRYIGISIGALIGLQLLLGVCSNAVYPIMFKIVADSSEEGTIVTGNGIMTTLMFFGAAVATSLMGFLIQIGGGWHSLSGYMTGVYVMVGAMVISFLLVVFFTRETNGPNFGKDFSLVSMKSCNLAKK